MASSSIPAALKQLNTNWFTHIRPRWVDILGSYAGKELFLVDGDALVQHVLDDRLIGIAKADSCDWQILHAIYSVESFLYDLKKRGAVFELVFFSSNRPLAIGTSSNSWISSSRSLAHKVLKAYIESLEFEVHEFEDVDDQEWKDYIFFNKPLFILGSDHTRVEEPAHSDEAAIEAANLLHRIFIKQMHDSGLHFATLQEMDFRDSLANTFLYDTKKKYNLRESITKAAEEAQSLLSSLNPEHSTEESESEESGDDSTSSKTLAAWVLAAAQHYLSSNPSPAPTHQVLLFAFLAHAQLIQSLDLSLRSQPAPSLSPELFNVLTTQFLPGLFTSLQKTMPEEVDAPPNLDGRIYSILLHALLHSEQEVSAIIGEEAYKAVLEQWTSELELPPVDFGALRQLAATQSATTSSKPPAEFQEFALYPFTAPILTELLSPPAVSVPTKALDDFGGQPPALEHFGPTSDSVFAPSKRSITTSTRNPPLPKHLGGEQSRPKDKKGIFKALRRNQQAMVHIERQASSLTGVKGAKLEAEVIPPTGVLIGPSAAVGGVALLSGVGSREVSRTGTPASEASAVAGASAKHPGAKGKKGSLLNSANSPSHGSPGGAGGKKGPGGKKGGAKEPPMKSADKLRAQIESQKKAKTSSDGETWWRNRLEELKNITDLKERIEMLDLQLKNNKRLDDAAGSAGAGLAANVWLYRINCECWHWVENPRRAEREVKDGYVVRLLKMVMGMKSFSNVPGGQNLLTPTMVKCLWSVLEVLGFEEYIEIIPKPTKDLVDKKLEWDFIKFYKKSKSGPNAGTLVNSYPWMAIGEDPVDWQLRVFGEHMDRSFDSQKDDRVKFEPDKWQREVLDKLDAEESVLVVAPTSAGKTFISYYAMKQVLMESDDGILVYVAPTKALVTQISAEVYARYRKDLKGKSCWAVHTPDIRMNNPQTCQILVTVPEMLAFMLLSPNMARLWTPRIRRIVLDEIHTLGTQPGGVWEQILLLARCPIIGLSATVGDADEFNRWLKSVQETHGHKHSLVQHHHRYSHLRKFTYNIDPEPEPFDGLPGHKPSEQMRFLHPISFIRPGITELPGDLALEARDCATLYRAMSMHSKDSEVSKLKPTRFFKKLAEKGIFLQQKDVIHYEEELKAVLTRWLKEEDAHKETSTIQKVVKQLTDREVGLPEPEEALEDPKLFYGNLVNLLADLHANGDLPALLFHFDRYHVEAVAKAILERLKEDETEWRKHSPEWAKKVKGWEDWEAGAKEREKAAQRAALKKEKAEGDKMERLQASAAVDSSPLAIYANFDPDAPSEEFTFINWGTRYSASELEEDIKKLAWTETPKFLLECLRRGIAVHHSGLTKGYRVLVETLFRIGFCRVVVSTDELALGVNMPAKASVFCGDSPALNALMYRQCAGRAGRRGFDLLGKVVFYGIPHERVKQVVLSRLPALRGNYPLTPTLSLRLITLLTNSGYAPSATRAVSDLLKLDSLTIGSDISREQTLFNMRFAVEYLVRARLIDSGGIPLHPWCNLATFLYTAEPANLAFLSLFRAGYIHKICNENTSIIDAKQKLMHILAFLFCRQYISKTNFDKAIFAANNRTPSTVLLPELDREAYKILREHNQEVLNVFTECAVMYAIQQSDSLEADKSLPLSQRTVDSTPASSSSSSFLQGLNKSRISSRSRSAFVATSGHGDVYTDVDELTRTVRGGVHLTKHVLPTLETFENQDQSGRYINAYLWDFYNHGQDKPISEANGIPRGQVWYLLMEFSMVLDAIVTGIKEVMVKDTRVHDDDMGSTAGESHAGGATIQDDWAAELEKDEVVVSTSSKVQGGPVEKERGDEAEATAMMASADPELTKPEHVPVRDWKVYDVFYQLQTDFNQKFKAMWA